MELNRKCHDVTQVQNLFTGKTLSRKLPFLAKAMSKVFTLLQGREGHCLPGSMQSPREGRIGV